MDKVQIIQVRREGGYIKSGINIQWTGGPIVWFMPWSRKWKIRFRLRFTTRGINSSLVWSPMIGFDFQRNPEK